jgi:general secretion pathway protein C
VGEVVIASRPALISRGGLLLARLPRPTVYSTAELVLIALIAVQAARLVWTALGPLGPVGEWRATNALAAPGDAVLAGFDPFFRLQTASGPATVTALNLKLYGTREDRASGRGSAIIALPDGRQLSFAVGELIMPGVTLTGVAFDSVTINHNGASEQIFLDQPAAEAAPGQPVPDGTQPAPPPTQAQPQIVAPPTPVPAPVPGQPIAMQPRNSGGRVTGIVVAPGGDGGQAFRAAGLVPGDVIVAINGRRVTSMAQARGLRGEVNVMVDRAGRAVPMRVRLNP